MFSIRCNKTEKKRDILKAKIGFISLCPAGANTIRTMYKADGKNENIKLVTINKDMTEQGELVCVVYAPDIVDTQGDMASEKVIKEFAYDFAKSGGNIDIIHNEKALDSSDIFIAESMIIQKNDPRFSDMKDYAGNEVDVTGGWGVILKVENEDLRKLYRSGEWGGISMGGTMIVKDVSEETSVIKMLKELLPSIIKSKQKENKSETDMELTKENIIEIVKAVKEATTAEKTEAEKVAKEAAEKASKEQGDKKLGLGFTLPVLKSDPTEEDITKHRKVLKIFELSKAVDPNNATALFEFEQQAKEIADSKNLSETLKKQEGSSLERFFTTNQNVGDVTNKSDHGAKEGETEAGNSILQKMDEEKKKKKIA